MKAKKFNDLLRAIQNDQNQIDLHRPNFGRNEKKYLINAIDSTNVSSTGKFIGKFEEKICSYIKNKYCVATVNGTSALQISLILANVKANDEVLTQSVSFVATSNAISYLNAIPIFIDVDLDSMGMSPKALRSFLNEYAEKTHNGTFNKLTKRKISACLPMHTFGIVCKIDEIKKICDEWNITLIEDSAEALGSKYKGKFAGTFGLLSAFSFNGNKIITSGGGGSVNTNNYELFCKAKHIISTAKKQHDYRYFHDSLGFNYRMPNINAALAYAQIQRIEKIIQQKKKLFSLYKKELPSLGLNLYSIPKDVDWNCWLFPLIFESKKEREEFIVNCIKLKIVTRPIWDLIYRFPMYKDCQRDSQENSIFLESRILNIPSNIANVQS